jgi:hypothetical protein
MLELILSAIGATTTIIIGGGQACGRASWQRLRRT